jgi:hypothetical protein
MIDTEVSAIFDFCYDLTQLITREDFITGKPFIEGGGGILNGYFK